MSYHSRRVHGRFTTNTASEAYQRQLIAPVKKWRRGWVVPKGLPEGSKYKVCRWVRADDLHGYSNEDGTPLPDDEDEGDEDDEGEDEEGDEGEGEDGDEPDGDDAEDGDDDEAVPATATAGTTSAEAATPAEPAAGTITVTDATPVAAAVPTDAPAVEVAAAPAAAAPETSASDAPRTQGVEVHAAHHIEEGLGDLGSGEMEVGPIVAASTEAAPSAGTPQAQAASDAAPAASEEEGGASVDAAAAGTVAAPAAAGDEGMDVDALAGVEHDAGLVMGEMAPPVEAMAVDGEDAAQPREVE